MIHDVLMFLDIKVEGFSEKFLDIHINPKKSLFFLRIEFNEKNIIINFFKNNKKCQIFIFFEEKDYLIYNYLRNFFFFLSEF